MEQKMQTYFIAEKNESIVFMLVGFLAIGVALFALFYVKKPIWEGLAIPFTLIALIQITVGVTIYTRTDKQLKTLIQTYQSEPKKYAKEELFRMQGVNKSFDIIKYVEIALLVAGLGILLWELFLAKDKPFWLGIGLGLAIQSSAMLIADFFAESRADIYTAQLMELEKNLQFQ